MKKNDVLPLNRTVWYRCKPFSYMSLPPFFIVLNIKTYFAAVPSIYILGSPTVLKSHVRTNWGLYLEIICQYDMVENTNGGR